MIKRSIPVFLVLVFFLSACGTAAPRTSGLPRVLAAESFLADIAQNVAGDRLKIDLLVPPGVDPHEYQPTPQDLVRIAGSQVLIVNGVGYEWWLQKTLDSLGGQRQVVVATDGLPPLKDPSGKETAGDPHMWLDPTLVVRYVENIRAGLTRADPAGAEGYAANAAGYIHQLNLLDQWITERVATISPSHRQLVTNHDSLAYFANRYGFTVVGAIIPSVSTDASPTAQDLARLVEQIKQTGAPAIFLEVTANPKLARQIAAETGIPVVTDLYLESLSAPDGPAPSYLLMMRHNVDTIVSACMT
jgi:zinc/manganese transport system substrate-binding protein